MGTEKNRLNEMVLLSTQNLCLNRWIRKYSQFMFKSLVYLDLSFSWLVESLIQFDIYLLHKEIMVLRECAYSMSACASVVTPILITCRYKLKTAEKIKPKNFFHYMPLKRQLRFVILLKKSLSNFLGVLWLSIKPGYVCRNESLKIFMVRYTI